MLVQKWLQNFFISLNPFQQSKKEDETARRKKTDEPSPDDAQRVEEEEEKAAPNLVPVGQETDVTSFIASADDELVISTTFFGVHMYIYYT